MSKGKIFCAYPYVSLFVANSGRQLPCCYAQNDHVSEVPTTHISNAQNIQDLWNSSYIKKIREMMDKGQFPAACSVCERTEALRGESHRQRSLEQFSDELNDVVVNTASEVESSIRHLDLRLGNKCNLACRMCHPMSSNQLIPEWLDSSDPSDRSEALDALKTIPWSRSEKSIALLQSDKVNPTFMHLAGGEPALDRRHEKVLEHLVASGKSERMTISYNTNLTQLVPVLKFKDQFRRVVITASIDGVGALNDYIRAPSKWRDIEKNFLYYLNERQQSPQIQLEVNVTVSAYNILYLKEILEYFAQLPTDQKIVPVFTVVQDPEWLHLSVLPSALLGAAQSKLRETIGVYKNEDADELLQERLTVFNEWLRFSRPNEKGFVQFCNKTEFYDRKRGVSVFAVMPEVREHWRQAPMLETSV